MTRALKSQNKIGFVDGTIVKQKDDIVKSLKWDCVNVIFVLRS